MTVPRTIGLLAGARPNYMKVFPLLRALDQEPAAWRPLLIHTGQHYDPLMNDVFFEDFQVRRPDHFLGVGSGPHGAQTGRIMIALEALFDTCRPDVLVVVGDVNSTLAGALVAVKMGVTTIHLEAGLRSGDRTMPEEINRLATDAVADWLLTPSADADEHLLREGHAQERICCVGNIMIDSLVSMLPACRRSAILETLCLREQQYALVTLHRPGNVDDPGRLQLIWRQLQALAGHLPVVIPLHPRTRALLDKHPEIQAGDDTAAGLHCVEPLGYQDFLRLESGAAVVVTDSGGIQEETTYLGIPCLTVRPNTERPVTITLGTNRLVDPDCTDLAAAALESMAYWRERPVPSVPLWDGNTAGRVVDVLREV